MMHQRSIAHAADWDIFLQTFSNVINECHRTTTLSILTWHTSEGSFQLVASPCQRNASKTPAAMKGEGKLLPETMDQRTRPLEAIFDRASNSIESKAQGNVAFAPFIARELKEHVASPFNATPSKCIELKKRMFAVEGVNSCGCPQALMVQDRSTLRKRRVGAGTWNNERSAQHQSFRPTYSRRLSFLDPNLVLPPLFPSNGMNQPPCKPPRIQNNASYQREVYQKPQRMRPPLTRNPNMPAPPMPPQQMTTPPPPPPPEMEAQQMNYPPPVGAQVQVYYSQTMDALMPCCRSSITLLHRYHVFMFTHFMYTQNL
ncbi:hypothetical protein CAEBREN_23918 [Caenorhabditis brenneri]|uniref:Uncharacterized protein n=1 Tax=Caenorhabditis brenneri TaxID=135651 RepID=G0P7D3_CAEBE|nr:hypothetical protein CAEBREN_23918 [Caenorhabditis brenneri]